MPTRKKRLMLTVTHDLHAVLKRWGTAQGIAPATLVSSFLEENKPIFQGLAVALEAQKQGKEKEALKAMSVLTGTALSSLGEVMKGKKSH